MRAAHNRSDKALQEEAPYRETDLERIAYAIGVSVDVVRAHGHAFENAAVWYHLDWRAPKRTAPSHLVRKLARIKRAAGRLLQSLGIDDASNAPDGPVDRDLAEALMLTDEPNASSFARSCARLGKLFELIEGIEAVAALRYRADVGEKHAAAVGSLITLPGHRGDTAINDWIGAMASLYLTITARHPGRSVGAPGRPDEGEAGGPFIRFLEAAGGPLGIVFGPEAWAKRIRAVVARSVPKN